MELHTSSTSAVGGCERSASRCGRFTLVVRTLCALRVGSWWNVGGDLDVFVRNRLPPPGVQSRVQPVARCWSMLTALFQVRLVSSLI